MPARPQVQPLEARRLFAAVGADVGWGRDGVVARGGQFDRYFGSIGREFFTSDNSHGNGTRVRRYSASGKRVSSFTPEGVNILSELATDDQGRIVAVDTPGGDRNVIEVRRYTSDGVPDKTLSGDGLATLATLGTDADGVRESVYVFTTDRTGAIYLFRSVNRSSSTSFTYERLVTKLRPDGTPDPTFGTNGTVTLPGSFGRLSTALIDLDSAGRIVTAARAGDQFLVTRLLPDGSLDRAYGENGTFAATLFVPVTDDRNSVALDGRGRLVFGNIFSNPKGTASGSRLRRLTQDGRPDDTFGTDGDAATTASIEGRFPNISVFVMPDGTISAQLDGKFWRLGDDGRPLRRNGRPALSLGITTLTGVTRDGTLLGRSYASGTESVARVVPLGPAAIGRTGRLYLYGDNGDDNFRLRRGSTDDEMFVDHNGRRVGVFTGVVGVNAELSGGDNVLLDRYLPNTRDLPMTVTSGAGRDSIYTGAGDDSIQTGTGHDTVYAGPGDDALTGETIRDVRAFPDAGADDVYHLGPGNDTASDNYGASTIYGGAGDDSIQTSTFDDRLYGGDGDDILTAGDGRDVAYGDSGEDSIAGGLANDRLFGGVGDDTIDAGRGDDRVYGNDTGTPDVPNARNVLTGGAGADRVRRESDDDELDGFEAELN